MYEGAAVAQPSIADLASFEGAFLDSLLSALAAPAPAPDASASSEAAAPAPSATAAAPSSNHWANALPETFGTLPGTAFGSEFSDVEPASAQSLAAHAHGGYRARPAAREHASLLSERAHVALAQLPNPLVSDAIAPRTAMHQAVAADAAARAAAAAWAPAGAPGSAVGAATAPVLTQAHAPAAAVPARQAMHEFVAADAAARSAAAAAAPADLPLVSVKESRARALPLP